MKRIVFLLCTMVLLVGHAFSQQRVVQGIAHPTPLPAKQQNGTPSLRADQTFTFDDIKFWVGEGQNRAALVIEWHDGNDPDAIVWGYKWDGSACGLDMITAIANADSRLIFLRQFTGPMGYTIDGLGYNCPVGSISYDLAGASSDSRVSFKFQPPYKMPNQTGHPATPEEDVRQALEEGYATGVINHPFNASVYGYACYDYDYWKCSSGTHWDAGWYDGYWSYWVRDAQTDEFTYSGLGASSRQLVDGSWDGWSYLRDMTIWTGAELGDYFTAAVNPNAKKVTGVSLDKSTLTLEISDTQQLVHTITPADADNKTVTWTSSKETVATVDAQGLVTAVAPGQAEITVKTEDGDFTAVCDVTVNNPPVPVAGVELDITDLSLVPGQTKTLTATVKPTDADNKAVTWTSSKETVATVDAQGLVTAVALGQAEITVKTEDGAFTDVCKVIVSKPTVPVTGVELDVTDLLLKPKQTKTLSAKVVPENADHKAVRWESSKETVATVDYQGLVTAVAPGQAKITVKTEDGSFTDVCEVIVTKTPDKPNAQFTNDSTVTINFTKIVAAAFYDIKVYVLKDDTESLFRSFRIDSKGSLLKSLRTGATENLSFTLKGLPLSSTYRIEIEAISESEKIIATYTPLKLTTPTGNLPKISEEAVSVSGKVLRLTGMEHCICHIYSLSGVLMTQFKVVNAIEYHTLDLPAGIYILQMEGRHRFHTRKIIIN